MTAIMKKLAMLIAIMIMSVGLLFAAECNDCTEVHFTTEYEDMAIVGGFPVDVDPIHNVAAIRVFGSGITRYPRWADGRATLEFWGKTLVVERDIMINQGHFDVTVLAPGATSVMLRMGGSSVTRPITGPVVDFTGAHFRCPGHPVQPGGVITVCLACGWGPDW